MTTTALRNAARRRLDALPAAKLRAAAEFLAFLEAGASDPATAELLRVPGLLPALRQARRDQQAGRARGWRKARDV